ncbi:unnamed protein product [Closterium sp. NIES-53]
MVCARALKQQQGQPQRQQLQHSRQWGPEGASESLCVGAASTTSLAPAFVAGLGATSQTAQLSFTLDPGASSSPPLSRVRRLPLGFSQATTPPPSLGTTAPLQTLQLDVWGPSPVLGPRQKRYFLIVVDDYSRYTTVFPLKRKAAVPTVFESWLLAWGGAQGLCGLHLHSDRGVRYAVHQLNLWPSDARPRVTPISLWTGSPSVVADFRVWGSLAHVRAPNANKLSPRIRACVFLGFLLDASGWVFYDPITYEFFASQDVRFEEFVCYYRSRPHRASSPVLSGGAGGAVAEGHVSLDSAASPRVTPWLPVCPAVPSRSSLRPVTGGLGGVGGGGAGSGGDGAGGTGTVAPTPRTARFLTREQHLLQLEREERERFERAQQQQQLQQEQCQSQSQQ